MAERICDVKAVRSRRHGFDRAAYHPLHVRIRQKQIVVDETPARIGRIDHAHAKPLDGGLFGGADPGHPAGQSRRQCERAVVGGGDDSDLACERTDAADRRLEHVHVDIGRSEHHGADPRSAGVAKMRIELTQGFERQHRPHAVRDDMDATDAG